MAAEEAGGKGSRMGMEAEEEGGDNNQKHSQQGICFDVVWIPLTERILIPSILGGEGVKSKLNAPMVITTVMVLVVRMIMAKTNMI